MERHSLSVALDAGECDPAALPLGKNRRNDWIGDWVGLRAGLGGLEDRKNCLRR